MLHLCKRRKVGPVEETPQAEQTQPPAVFEGIVKLNVGGSTFITTRSTLEQQPESMLARMFMRRQDSIESLSDPFNSGST